MGWFQAMVTDNCGALRNKATHYSELPGRTGDSIKYPKPNCHDIQDTVAVQEYLSNCCETGEQAHETGFKQ